jgi:starch synthase
MVAMREGQPCVVHAVGGLKDTVTDGVNGFAFGGTTLQEQADGLVLSVSHAVGIYFKEPGKWQSIVNAAKSARFTWKKSAQEYIDLMYQ